MIILLPKTKTKKISNNETGEYVYFRKVEKMDFSLLLYIFDFISTKWKIFHHSH